MKTPTNIRFFSSLRSLRALRILGVGLALLGTGALLTPKVAEACGGYENILSSEQQAAQNAAQATLRRLELEAVVGRPVITDDQALVVVSLKIGKDRWVSRTLELKRRDGSWQVLRFVKA